MANLHPKSGLRYVVAIPGAATFDQVRVCYQALAARVPWLEVVSQEEFPGRFDAAHDDGLAFFLLWGFTHPVLQQPRGAHAALVFSEPLGPFDVMLPEHIDLLGKTWKMLRCCDAVFLHTPTMAKRMQQLAVTPAYVLPVGWDPRMGQPDFGRQKADRVVYWGSHVGRRIEIIPALRAALGELFRDASGSYGPALSDALQGSRAGLYIGHSAVPNASTFRIWQALVTSSPLIAEGEDWWPLRNDEHYLEIPPVIPCRLPVMVETLQAWLTNMPLATMARRAWQDIAPDFTIDHCVERFLVPASIEIADSPGSAS